jgi:hypothetical protein
MARRALRGKNRKKSLISRSISLFCARHFPDAKRLVRMFAWAVPV